MTTSEYWNKDRPVHWELFFWLLIRPQNSRQCSKSAVNLSLAKISSSKKSHLQPSNLNDFETTWPLTPSSWNLFSFQKHEIKEIIHLTVLYMSCDSFHLIYIKCASLLIPPTVQNDSCRIEIFFFFCKPEPSCERRLCTRGVKDEHMGRVGVFWQRAAMFPSLQQKQEIQHFLSAS